MQVMDRHFRSITAFSVLDPVQPTMLGRHHSALFFPPSDTPEAYRGIRMTISRVAQAFSSVESITLKQIIIHNLKIVRELLGIFGIQDSLRWIR